MTPCRPDRPAGPLDRDPLPRSSLIAWALVALGLGVFAPARRARALGRRLGGDRLGVRRGARAGRPQLRRPLGSYGLMVVVHSRDATAGDPAFERAVAEVERTLRVEATRVSVVVAAAPGRSISARRPHRGRAGRRRRETPTRWCAPPTTSRTSSAALGGGGVEVNLTGASGMWSDFNEANKTAMLKSELISWPVTLAILVLAFGSLVAAGPAADADDPRAGRRRRLALPRHAAAATSRSGR